MPLPPGLVVCVSATTVLWINYGRPNVTAVAVVIVYGCYLIMVTVPPLSHRVAGTAEHTRCDTRYSNLGR